MKKQKQNVFWNILRLFLGLPPPTDNIVHLSPGIQTRRCIPPCVQSRCVHGIPLLYVGQTDKGFPEVRTRARPRWRYAWAVMVTGRVGGSVWSRRRRTRSIVGKRKLKGRSRATGGWPAGFRERGGDAPGKSVAVLCGRAGGRPARWGANRRAPSTRTYVYV